MKLVETKISETAVHLRYADNADPVKATEWIDLQAPLRRLEHPLPQGRPQPLGDPESNFVAEVQVAALRYMRDAIGEEIQRLSGLIGRIR